MMTMIQKKILLTSVLAISIVTLAGISQQQIFAEETDEKQYTHANDVTIHTVFSFRDAVEESDGFQVFKQMSSLGAHSPTFKLEGIVDFGREYLYEAVDDSFRNIGLSSQYGQFDVDIYLHNEGTTLRHLNYSDCSVSDYKVTTLTDKVESWTSDKGFAIVDEFEFECLGYHPYNPLYELMKTNGYHVETESTLDLEE